MIGSRTQMIPLLVVVVLTIVVALVFGGFFGRVVIKEHADGARYRVGEQAAQDASVATLPAPAPLRFAAGVSARDRRDVLAAIERARPPARRLIALVAGITTVDVAPLGAELAGSTAPSKRGYAVVLDLAPVRRYLGARGVAHLTLHELGHVVDDALVTGALERRLEQATPPGIICEDRGTKVCPARAERFAESFAKWASGDPFDDRVIGYRVPAPRPLAAWGEPLAIFTRRAG